MRENFVISVLLIREFRSVPTSLKSISNKSHLGFHIFEISRLLPENNNYELRTKNFSHHEILISHEQSNQECSIFQYPLV